MDALTEPITECLNSVKMPFSSVCDTTSVLAWFLNKPRKEEEKEYNKLCKNFLFYKQSYPEPDGSPASRISGSYSSPI